jgi:hypothetical protein
MRNLQYTSVQTDPCRSTLQFERKTLGEGSVADGRIRATGKRGNLDPENNTRSLGRHDWDHQIASEFFHESLRKLGLIEYNGRIRVRKSLLNVILHDQFSG